MSPSCAHDGKSTFFITGKGEVGVVHCMECVQSWPAEVAPLDLLNRLTRHLVVIAAERNALAN